MAVVGRATVRVDVDSGLLAKSLKVTTEAALRSAAGFRGLTGATIGAMGSFAKMAGVVGAVNIGVSQLVTSVGGALGAIGQMSGVLAALPAFGLAGAAAIGTMVVAFKGFSTAGGEAGKLRETFKGFGAQWADLKKSVQDNMFAGLAKPFRDLGNNYLPVLKKGMSGIAGSFNAMTKTAVTFLNTQQSLNDTATGLGNTKKMFDNLNASVQPIWQAIRDLAVEGSTFLPGFGKQVSGVAQSFGNFIAEARESGKIQIWIENGVNAFKLLGKTVANIFSIFQSIFSAAGASGFGFLNTLEEVTGSFAALLSWADIQDGLAQVFSSGTKALSSFISVLMRELGPLLAAAGPAIAKITTAVGKVAETFVQVLGPVLTDIIPTIGLLAETLGAGLSDAMLRAKPGIEAITGGFKVLAPLIGGTFMRVLGLLADTFSMISPILMKFAETVLPPIMRAIETLLPPIMSLIETALPPLAALFEKVAPLIGSFIEEMATAFVPIINDIADMLPSFLPLLDLMIFGFQGIGGVIKDVVMPVLGWLVGFFKDNPAQLYILIGALVAYKLATSGIETATKAWAAVQGLLNKVMNMSPIAKIVTALTLLGAAVVYAWQHSETFRDVLKKVWEVIQGVISFAWNNVIKPVMDALVAAFQWVVSAVGAAADFISAAWTAVAGFLSDVWDGIIAGVQAAWGFVRDYIIQPLQTAWDWIVNLFSTIVGWIDDHILQPIVGAVQAAFGFVKDYIIAPLQAAWDWITGVFSAIGNFIADKIWEPIKNGAKAAFGFIKSAIIDPLKAAFDWVVNIFAGIGKVFGDIWQGMIDTMKKIFSGAANIVSDAFSGVVDFLKSIVNGVIKFFNNTVIWGINTLIDGANLIPWVDIPHVPLIPELAKGGIIESTPGGMVALLGEGGNNERVEPLDPSGLSARDHALIDKLAGGVAGGITVVVKIGETELREIVGYEVEQNNNDLARGLHFNGQAAFS